MSVQEPELDIGHLTTGNDEECGAGLGAVSEAIASARDQERVTWLTDDGERVAAIVPGRIAELGAYPMYLFNGETGELSVVSAVRAEAELRALCVRAFTLLDSAEQMCPEFGERENVRLWRERYHACRWDDDALMPP